MEMFLNFTFEDQLAFRTRERSQMGSIKGSFLVVQWLRR